MSTVNDTPTAAQQEEYYDIIGEWSHAGVATSKLRTAYIFSEEWDDLLGDVGADVFEYLTVATMAREDRFAKESGGRITNGMYAGYILKAAGLEDDEERRAHNERALAIARYIAAEVRLTAFVNQPEHRGKKFQFIRDEVLERAITDDIEPLFLEEGDRQKDMPDFCPSCGRRLVIDVHWPVDERG